MMMKKAKKTVRQGEITRYVYSLIRRCSATEPQPVSEVALAQQFEVQRLTIQRALARFVENGTLIRLPRRRGLFTNPVVAQNALSYRFFGIIAGDHQSAFIDSASQTVINGFTAGMRDVTCEYHYMKLESDSCEDIIREIENSGLDALLWIGQDDSDMAPINELLLKNYPLVVVPNLYSSYALLPTSNFIRFDFEQVGRLRAAYVKARSWHRMLYWGSGATFDSFSESFNAAEKEFIKSHRVATLKDLRPVVCDQALLRSLDGIVSDGWIMSELTSLYQQYPLLRQIPLLLDPVPAAREVAMRHADCPIEIPPYSFHQTLEKIGLRASVKVKTMLKKAKTFEGETVGGKFQSSQSLS